MFRSNILIDVTRGNDEEEIWNIDLGKGRPQRDQRFLQEDTQAVGLYGRPYSWCQKSDFLVTLFSSIRWLFLWKLISRNCMEWILIQLELFLTRGAVAVLNVILSRIGRSLSIFLAFLYFSKSFYWRPVLREYMSPVNRSGFIWQISSLLTGWNCSLDSGHEVKR